MSLFAGKRYVRVRASTGADMFLLGVPRERIRALGDSWADGGLWDDILWLAFQAWSASGDDHGSRAAAMRSVAADRACAWPAIGSVGGRSTGDLIGP